MLIDIISFVLASLGATIVLILAYRVHTLNAEEKLHKHRSKKAGVMDLLNYAAVVDDGVIVCKNGSFMASWMYKGNDNASSTDDQRELVSLRINQAIAGLGNGWMLHVDAVRRPSMNYSNPNDSSFPDPVSLAIDEERRALFESYSTMYEGYFVLTVTWFPPLLAQQKFVELMFDDDKAKATAQEGTKALIDSFKKEVESLEQRLSLSLKLSRLKGRITTLDDGSSATYDDFLSWLQYCLTGISQPIALPENPMYIDSYLGGQEFEGGVVPRMGDKYIQVVAIEGFPLDSHPGILSSLAELAIEYRWSSRYICMDPHEAEAHYKQYRKKWKQKVRGFVSQVFNTQGAINEDALEMVNDASSAIKNINSGVVSSGYYTTLVVLMSESRNDLSASAVSVQKAIRKLGFVSRIETLNTMDAFMGSLPGHGVENVRRPMIDTLNLADMLPTSSIWTGQSTAPCDMYPPNSPPLMHCATSGSTPFHLNLHVNDVGHTLMFGPTGSGKSVHLATLIAQQLRYKNMSIYAFDKGMSLYPLTKATGGSHFEVGGDSDELQFCPLQFLESKSDRSWAMNWIDSILALNGVITTPGQRNEIGNAIVSMHQSSARTLSEFTLTIQDDQIREALKNYTVDGLMGSLLDAEEDGLSISKFTTFEIEELMNLGDKYALPILMYLFRRIERSLKGQPAAIYMDEAWLMLGNSVFKAKIREWLKVLRKNNCIVVMATQSLSDAAASGILDVMVESTATKIFLPNPDARDEDTSNLYKRMGLNRRQIDILANAVQKRQYYYVSEQGRRLYELALGPVALAFVSPPDKESLETIKNLEHKFEENWVHEWLATKGQSIEKHAEVA